MINGRTVMLNVDFNDQCDWTDERKQGLYDKARIENLVRQCKKRGLISFCGV